MASKEQDKGKIGKGKKITVRGVVRDVQATPCLLYTSDAADEL